MKEVRVPPFRILLAPGEGWGTGSHETTQLCLQAIGLLFPWRKGPFRMLDFGSGSGLLAIAAAQLGASVAAVEIDEAGIAHARENARINGVENSIRFSRMIESPPGSCDLVAANILRPILLEFASVLVGPLKTGGMLVLSGLVATDLPEVSVRYSALLGGREPEIFQRGEWRALVWRPA